jgi:hypothetical protein
LNRGQGFEVGLDLMEDACEGLIRQLKTPQGDKR